MLRYKTVPEELFIAKPARITAIAQLCIALTMLCWILSQPFMGATFTAKKNKLLFESVMKQKELFSALPPSERQYIEKHYSTLLEQSQKPFATKVKESWQLFTQGINVYKRLWIILAIAIPILLLKKREGGRYAAWLLPLLACAFAFDNYSWGIKSGAPADETFFPSEKYLVGNYLSDPFSKKINEQYEQLKKAWDNYLIVEWAGKGSQSYDRSSTGAVVKGTFEFNLARLHARIDDGITLPMQQEQHAKLPIPLLALFVAWNAFFALQFRRCE